MAAAKTTKPAAPKAPAAPKVEKKGSVLAGLDNQVNELALEVEKQVKLVGGDIARGHADKAVSLIKEAANLLVQAERADA